MPHTCNHWHGKCADLVTCTCHLLKSTMATIPSGDQFRRSSGFFRAKLCCSQRGIIFKAAEITRDDATELSWVEIHYDTTELGRDSL